MFVSNLFIRNFRGIAKAEIHFQKGVNVLVGRNGSGKTTILAALRLVLDTFYGRQRTLDENDFHGDAKFSDPADVIIGVKLADFGSTQADKRLKLALHMAPNETTSKWLVFRFRPRDVVRTQISKEERQISTLDQSDYEADRSKCVDADLSKLGWDDDHGGSDLNDKDLAALRIVEIQALRDVVDAMKRERTSPLASLIETFKIPKIDRDNVETAYESAQTIVEKVPAFSELATEVRKTYLTLANDIDLSIKIGLTKPSFSSIVRDLGMLLTDDYVSEMELRKNGLGLNNLLYIAMLLETFERKRATDEIPLLLVEEPEAHLHPQAQLGLMNAFHDRAFQTIVTTHSPFVAMAAGVETIINLDRDDAIKGINLSEAGHFTDEEIADLNRFLALDRGVLLFAAGIILVEGPSEQILIPAYADNMGHNLSRLGIQVSAINGTHFLLYERLFGASGLNRPFVIIKDGDAQNGQTKKLLPTFDDGRNIATTPANFVTKTTLEYAITQTQTLPALKETFETFGLRDTIAAIDAALKASSVSVDGELQKVVLKAASRVGKARFAQKFGSIVRRDKLACPPYILEAINAIIKARASRANVGVAQTAAIGAQAISPVAPVAVAGTASAVAAAPSPPRRVPPPPPKKQVPPSDK